MSKTKQYQSPIDWKLFESVVIYNAIVSETYLASIVDVINPEFFNNTDKKRPDLPVFFYVDRNIESTSIIY